VPGEDSAECSGVAVLGVGSDARDGPVGRLLVDQDGPPTTQAQDEILAYQAERLRTRPE